MPASTARSTYSIELRDDTSGAAGNAANALAQLRERITSGVSELRAMQQAMRNLKGSSNVSKEAIRELTDRIAAQKASIAQAQSAYIRLGGTFEKVKPKIQPTQASLRDLLGSFRSLGTLAAAGGPVVAAILAVAGAFAALLAAVGAATAALVAYGIAQANARRDELLQLEGLVRLRSAYGVAAGSASELQAAIDRVSSTSVQGRREILGMAEGLYRAGLRGRALRESLEALSIVEAAQGAAGVARLRGRIIADARAGRSAQRLADIQARLGDIARRRALSLDVQARRLRENISGLFDDVKIDGFLRELNELTQLLSTNSVVGRGLKSIVDAIFPPMLSTFRVLRPIAQAFFEGLVIGALLLTVQILRLRNWLRDTFGDNELFANLDLVKVALYTGVAAFGAFTVAVAAATAGLAALAAGVAMAAVPVAVTVAAFISLGAAVAAGINRLVNTDWAWIGRSIIDGLVNGIRGGIDRVTGAIRDLAGRARKALTDALQIRSPSRVFAGLGLQIPAGLVAGVELGTPRVAGAVERMVDIPSEAVGDGGAPRSRIGGEVHISVGDIHVYSQATNVDELVEDLRDQVASLFEGVARTMGAPA